MSYFFKLDSLCNLKKIIPAVFFGICCNAFAAKDLVPTLMEEGMKNYANKKYDAAADYLGQVVDMDRDHSQARYYLIYSLSLSGNNELALKHAEILSKKFPKEKQYKVLCNQIKAEIKRQITKREQSEIPSGKIKKEVMFGGYQSLDKNAELQKPKENYAPRDIAPPRPLTEVEKAIRKIDEEDFDGAESMLKSILSKEPKNAEAQHNLGVVQFSRGDYKEAIVEFKKSLQIGPNSFQSQFLLADSYRNLGDVFNAEKEFKKAVDIKFDEFALMNLADIEIKLGKFKEAQEVYEKILAKSPDSTEASVGIAQILVAEGKLEQAMELVNKALSKGSGGEANYIKAKILVANSMYQEALEQIEAALRVYPSNVKYILERARINVAGMNITQGLDDARAILEVNKDNVEARLVIAEAFIATSMDIEAEDQLNEVSGKGEFPDYYRLRAFLQKKKGDTEGAKESFYKYLELSGGLPGFTYEYASFLELIGLKNEAVEMYESIAQRYPESVYAVKSKESMTRLSGNSNDDELSIDGPHDAGYSDARVRPGKVKY